MKREITLDDIVKRKAEIDSSEREKELKAKEEARTRVLDRLAQDRYDLVLKDILNYDLKVDNAILRRAAENVQRGMNVTRSLEYSIAAYEILGCEKMIRLTKERLHRLHEANTVREEIEAVYGELR